MSPDQSQWITIPWALLLDNTKKKKNNPEKIKYNFCF